MWENTSRDVQLIAIKENVLSDRRACLKNVKMRAYPVRKRRMQRYITMWRNYIKATKVPFSILLLLKICSSSAEQRATNNVVDG
jgi:chloramphenicol O-acetyltransferase